MSKRLTIELSDDAFQVLDDLAKRAGKSRVDILRESLGLRRYAQDLDKEGKTLVAITADGKVDSKIVLA